MAVEDEPGAKQPATDDGMADWAEALLDQKGEAGKGDDAAAGGVLSGESPRPFSASGTAADTPMRDINMVLDIPVQLSVELGRTKVSIKHILQLGQGSVVELDALAGEPMDVLVNGTLIAHGEVVVVNEKFGIRLTDVISPAERVKKLK